MDVLWLFAIFLLPQVISASSGKTFNSMLHQFFRVVVFAYIQKAEWYDQDFIRKSHGFKIALEKDRHLFMG